MQYKWQSIFLILLIAVSFISFFIIEPIPQDLAYHNFADTRSFFGISNFYDVTSNIPFLLVGTLGLWLINHESTINFTLSWQILFISILLVAFGSAYYHLNPTSKTLMWDRLPMATAFMALFAIVIGNYINTYLEKVLLIPMCLFGIISVLYWNYTDDLRLYAWVQFVSIALMLIIVMTYKSNRLHTKYLVYAFIFYTLSKIFEFLDTLIFIKTSEILSGHTIKHLFASISTYYFYILAKYRKS